MSVTVTPLGKAVNRQCNWTSIRATEDGKAVWCFGNSHDATGDNSVYLYNGGWSALSTDTGHLFNTTTEQFDPDPETGVTPVACTNRDNHQLLYVPAMRSVVILGNITKGPYGGRFNIDTGPDWDEVWETEADCAASFIAGMANVTQNPAHEWSLEHNCGLSACGTKSGTPTNKLMVYAPNPAGPQPYRLIELDLPIADRYDLRSAGMCNGDWFYFGGGRLRESGNPRTAEFFRVNIPDALNSIVTIEQLADIPTALRYPAMAWNTDLNLGMMFGGSTDIGATNTFATYDAATNVWTTHDNTAPAISIPASCFIPGMGMLVGLSLHYDPVTGDGLGWQASSTVDCLHYDGTPGGEPPPPTGISQAEALAAIDTETAYVNGDVTVTKADALAANDTVRQYIEQ